MARPMPDEQPVTVGWREVLVAARIEGLQHTHSATRHHRGAYKGSGWPDSFLRDAGRFVVCRDVSMEETLRAWLLLLGTKSFISRLCAAQTPEVMPDS